MGRTLVCRCEDVTVEDLKQAFSEGYRDLESLKRFARAVELLDEEGK